VFAILHGESCLVGRIKVDRKWGKGIGRAIRERLRSLLGRAEKLIK
jgi:hypothetical protein